MKRILFMGIISMSASTKAVSIENVCPVGYAVNTVTGSPADFIVGSTVLSQEYLNNLVIGRNSFNSKSGMSKYCS